MSRSIVGDIERNQGSGGFPHRLYGPCDCGQEHNPESANPNPPAKSKKGKGKGHDPSQADRLLMVVKPIFDEGEQANADGTEGAHSELFKDAEGEVYATVPVGNHFETYLLASTKMRRWLTYVYYKQYKTNINPEARKQVIEGFQARAQFDGEIRQVHLRIAQPDPDCIWLDLNDEHHQAVMVTTQRWLIVNNCPIKFLQKKGGQALPLPASPERVVGETLGEAIERLLRPYINIAAGDETGWTLFITWLLSTFRPDRPFPLLQLHGEKGSAKTTVGKVARRLVDPQKVELESQPKDSRDLAIAAQGTWLLAYDNLSHISEWLSDTFCRMSTGAGFRTRALYTNDEEALFAYMRPVLLTGIDEVVTRADLLGRVTKVFRSNSGS